MTYGSHLRNHVKIMHRVAMRGRFRRKAAIALAILVFIASQASADSVHNGVRDRPFLDLMGKVEGPNGYDEITRATRLRPERPLTQLTIREVLDFQRQVRASGASSSAMGRYQFIYQTLDYMVTSLEIDPDLRFDPITQDALARIEMRRCGFYEPVISDARLANCLAAIWAALPLVSGPNAGRSRFHGIAGNRALVSKSEFLSALRKRFPDSAQASLR